MPGDTGMMGDMKALHYAARHAIVRAQRIAAAMMLFVMIGAAGCPHTVRPTGDEIADCAGESAKDIFHTLLPRVSTILATGANFANITIELTKLVAEYGVETITCVVDAVRNRNGQAAAVASGDEKELHERSESWAEQWIAENGAQIKQ